MQTQKKKMLFVAESFSSGVFAVIEQICKGIIDTYDVYIAYGLRDVTPKNFEEHFDSRVHFIEVKNFTRSLNPVKDLRAFMELKKIKKEVNPDIIHLHSSKAGALGRFAFNGRKTPMFYTPHGYSFLMRDQNALKRFIYKSIEAVCAKRKCTIISCGEGEHKESLKLTKNAIYINNGIDIAQLEAFCSSDIPKDNREFSVFTLGRISFPRNPALFNKIALSLPDIRFVWVGDGELRNELTAPNIEVTGWVDRHRAISHSVNSDVFVLTSLWEGLPISLLEAMYMKKLSIVSDVIGNHDVIKDSVNGFVCTTAEEFSEKIAFAKNSDCSSFIEEAYKDIIEIYNTDVMIDEYIKVYGAAVRKNEK